MEKKVSWWNVTQEHWIKCSIFVVVISHALRSFQKSSTVLSQAFNSMVGAFFFWSFLNELKILRKRNYLPPGGLGLPLLGEIPGLILMRGNVGKYLEKKQQEYGSVFLSSLPWNPTVFLADQEGLAWLFNNDRKAKTEGIWPPNISALLGPGAIANKTGSHHKAMRRLIQPWFAPTFVKNYLKVMDETTLSDMEKWTTDFQSSTVFKLYALRLFFVSSFGKADENALALFHDDYTLWIQGFMSLTGTLRFPNSVFDKAMKARDRILVSIDVLIDEFMSDNPEGSDRAENTIMGRLVYGRDEDQNQLSRDEIKDNLLNLVFAGHDTTYASMSTVLHHLSFNQDAKEALHEEVKTFQEPLDADELKNAPVLNAVISEAWRMDPPVLAGNRKAQEDLTYQGYKFPKGTIFGYSTSLALHDGRVYQKAPKEFNFRRFLPKDHALYEVSWHTSVDPAQGRADYPVFGGGTKVCLGKAFAQLEMQVMLTRLFQNYTVDVKNNTKNWFPVNGWALDFKLKKRF